jgi:ribonuclease-3
MRPNSSHTGKRRRNRARGATEPPGLAATTRERVEAAIGRRFADPALLDRALTHRSAAPNRPDWSNERLEFLGDRVLGLVIAEALLERHPLEREGELARRLAALVSRDACAAVAADLGLAELVVVDAAERLTGVASRPSLLADALEALIGAVHLDGGLPAARKLVLALWRERFAGAAAPPKDPKSALQEWAQGAGLAAPLYISGERTGPDHAPEFRVTVAVAGLEPATAAGPSKQDAERAAARLLLARIAEAGA